MQTQQPLTQRSKEPSVLAAGVSVFQSLLDRLLGLLTLGNLLESVRGNGTLETLELQSVPGGHQVIVVDDLDEWLDLAALLNQLLAHAAGHLRRVALDTGDNGVGERVSLGAVVERLNDDDLLAQTKSHLVSAYPKVATERIVSVH